MTRRTFGAGLAALALTVLAGCADPKPQVVLVQPEVTCDTRFRVTNLSNRTVERFFFSHSNLNAWGADQLGASVLPPGTTLTYRAANPGNYDFRVIWANGREAELRRVNICAASAIAVHDYGLSAR